LSEIALDTLNGYQFQEFVANLFRQLGFRDVKVGPPGADEGIDIEMEQTTDIGTVRYIVECKHHPNGTIGRPVIQKLHSEIVTKGRNKGLVVTSGRFSGEAVAYAETVGVELVDEGKLVELCRKAGVRIRETSELMLENCYPVSAQSKIVQKLLEFLGTNLIGFQDSYIHIQEISLTLYASYKVDYTVRSPRSMDTKSSVFVNGETGRELNRDITDPFLPATSTLREYGNMDFMDVRTRTRTGFSKSFTEIKEKAREDIRRIHTRTVSHTGRNNVMYSKQYVPSNRDLTISGARRVYVPVARAREMQ
jgi:restriction system protein